MAMPSSDTDELAKFGYKQELDRSLGLFSSFAAGFSYISIMTGVFELFFFGFGTGGLSRCKQLLGFSAKFSNLRLRAGLLLHGGIRIATVSVTRSRSRGRLKRRSSRLRCSGCGCPSWRCSGLDSMLIDACAVASASGHDQCGQSDDCD